jgi:hypothetical protein
MSSRSAVTPCVHPGRRKINRDGKLALTLLINP